MSVDLPAPAPPDVRSLRAWGIALAQSAISVALGLLVFLISFGALLEEFDGEPPTGLITMYGVDALVGMVATLVIGPLRFLPLGRWHSAAHLPLAAAAGISVWSVPAAAIALYRLGMRRRLVLDVGAIALLTGFSLIALSVDERIRGNTPEELVLIVAGVMAACGLIPLLLGHVAGTRQELMISLRERAASAEREREAADRERETAQQARAAAEREAAALIRERDAETARVRAEERAALARDMHDSVSHHLSAIAMHAGAISYREDLSGSEVRRAAGTVRDAAQQANRELRTVLTTLRAHDGGAPLATALTLTGIVEHCEEQGQPVALHWEGLTPEDLDAHDRSTVVALARILTELTANAAKHAPGAALQITIAREGDRVVLRARNPLPDAPVSVPTSTGHGLLGVQERARLLGGEARHGVHEGGFEVEAWMPW